MQSLTSVVQRRRRPVGRLRPLSGEKIEINYPSGEVRFRNPFTYDAGKDKRRLITAAEAGGHWFVFAECRIFRTQ
jgi:hypothetical protein